MKFSAEFLRKAMTGNYLKIKCGDSYKKYICALQLTTDKFLSTSGMYTIWPSESSNTPKARDLSDLTTEQAEYHITLVQSIKPHAGIHIFDNFILIWPQIHL